MNFLKANHFDVWETRASFIISAGFFFFFFLPLSYLI